MAGSPSASSGSERHVVLQVEGLNVFYGGIHAVKNLSLEARRGELTTLIGANGAGKTTTLEAILGLLPGASGKVLFNGEEITGRPVHENVTERPGSVSRRPAHFPGPYS